MSAKGSAPILLAIFLGILDSPAADPPTRDPGWAEALKAYSDGRSDDGHQLLVTLAGQHPGDYDLAAACYDEILMREGRRGADNPWIKKASEHLLSLERLGVLSARSAIVQAAGQNGIESALVEGRLLEAHETLTRLHGENRHDFFWRVLQARISARLELAEARSLFAELKQDLDDDHPDPEMRERWKTLDAELKLPAGFPKPIIPVPEGSPLLLTAPFDPDGQWRAGMDRSPKEFPAEVDRLVARALNVGQCLPWRDAGGGIDPSYTVDLHLLSKPAIELDALRKEQEENFSRGAPATARTEADALALSRRYAWSRSAQERLLKLANTSFWDGRSDSALRSFQEVLLHSNDPALREAAQIGFWTALAFSGGAEEVLAQAGAFESGKTYAWMGKQARGAEIRAVLLAAAKPPSPGAAPSLQTVRPHVLHLPPVTPWPSDPPVAGFGVDLQVAGSKVVASGRNILVAYDAANPDTPLWAHLHRYPVEEARVTGIWPGYYRPLIHNGTIVSRWGLASLPSGLAAFDLASGHPLWSALDAMPTGSRREKGPLRSAIPMGDPVRADGMLFYLQWGTVHNVQDRNGLSVSLVCSDPRTARPRWATTIAEGGPGPDPITVLDSVNPPAAIYGNSVTVHRGAVYSNSNAGIIARSDVRDGRVEWIHNYRRNRTPPPQESLGSAPLMAGDKIICMPRDSGRVFALDQRTGRLVWDNPMILPIEALGICEDTLVVRGLATLAGLDLATGKARWFQPLPPSTFGRAQLIADSVYLGQNDELRRLDARTGELRESRAWALAAERPLGFTLSGQNLFIVSDRPTSDLRQGVGKSAGPALASASGPLTERLQRTWSLSRNEVSIALPPAGSSAGLAFLLSDGVIECLDLNRQGASLWRRFLAASNPGISFVGDTLILVERGRSRFHPSRVTVLHSRDGTLQWETPLPFEIGRSYQFGSRLLFHDGREKMVAFDLATGKRAWERRLGKANLMIPFWDGKRLQVVQASRWHVLDPDTGRTISQKLITVGNSPVHGQQIADGYYQIRFKPTPARFVRLTALSDTTRRGWASGAEIHVLGSDGQRLPRDQWSVEANYEQSSAPLTRPGNLIDGDPNTSWHTPWTGGILKPPHDFFVNLGATQTVTGFQYLPARFDKNILRNNGTIRDYELRLSQDKDDWGEPVAKGVLVNYTEISRAEIGPSAVFFEAPSYPKREQSVFRCTFDGEAVLVEDRARLLSMRGRHALVSAFNQAGKEILVVYRSDDPSYRFDISSRIENARHPEIMIEGDRLLAVRSKIVIADLNSKQFLNLPADEKALCNQGGAVVRIGPDRLLKIVSQKDKQALVTIDLQNGAIAEGVLGNQIEPFNEGRFLRPDGQQLISFDRTLILYDNSTLSAWATAP